MAMREDPNKIKYKERPKYLKNPKTGVVFVATDALIERGDMIPVDNPNGDTTEQETAFNYKKATKVQIVRKAKELFGAELNPDDDLKALRQDYKQLLDNAEAAE